MSGFSKWYLGAPGRGRPHEPVMTMLEEENEILLLHSVSRLSRVPCYVGFKSSKSDLLRGTWILYTNSQ